MSDGGRSRFYLRGRPDVDGDLTWGNVSRYDRRARVVAVDWLTETGTVLISLRVSDGEPFDFLPGQWIGVEEEVPGVGFRRSSYCIFSPPTGDGRFALLIRVLVDGALSQHLAALEPGHSLRFRGPMGRSLLPRATDSELTMLATGVGLAPLYSLCAYLSAAGEARPIRLYWGLRLRDDICLTDALDALVADLPDFQWRISLSRPPEDGATLRGRVTESVPPRLDRLAGKRFYLSGNGAMIEEMELALSSLGVDRTSISEERFFNLKYHADRAEVEAIMARFVADDLVDAAARLRGQVWHETGSQ